MLQLLGDGVEIMSVPLLMPLIVTFMSLLLNVGCGYHIGETLPIMSESTLHKKT